jgi:hypothetical protein
MPDHVMEEIMLPFMNSSKRLDLSLMILVFHMKLVLKNPLKDHAKEDLNSSNVTLKTLVELAIPSALSIIYV